MKLKAIALARASPLQLRSLYRTEHRRDGVVSASAGPDWAGAELDWAGAQPRGAGADGAGADAVGDGAE